MLEQRPKAAAFVLTATVYGLAFFSLTLGQYDHHDGFQTLSRAGALNWYDVHTGRPLFAVAQSLATTLSHGIYTAVLARAIACVMMAGAAGIMAAHLVQRLPLVAACAMPLAIFALPGAVLTFMMLQSSLLAPTVLIALGAGYLVLWRQSAWTALAAYASLLVVLFWYQSNAPIMFLPIIAGVFLDPMRDRARVIVLAGAVFLAAGLTALMSGPIWLALGPAASSLGNHAASIDLAEMATRLTWLFTGHATNLGGLWFSRYRPPYVGPALLVLLAAAIAGASRRSTHPFRFALAAVGLLCLADIFSLIAPRTAYEYERVRWPVQAALLLPILIEASRRLALPAAGLAAAAILVLATVIPVQKFVTDGRVVFDSIELGYAREEIARQVGAGRDATHLLSITAGQPAGPAHQDELFFSTSDAIGSLPGMIMLVYRERGLAAPNIMFLGSDATVTQIHEQIARAEAANEVVVDFRRMPVGPRR